MKRRLERIYDWAGQNVATAVMVVGGITAITTGLAVYAIFDAESIDKRVGPNEPSPCRHALGEELPAKITVSAAVDELIAHPNSNLSVKVLRPAVDRAVQAPECRDQAFLVCSATQGLDSCVRAFIASHSSERREVVANSGGNPSGQLSPGGRGPRGPSGDDGEPGTDPPAPVQPSPPSSPGNSGICVPGVLPQLPAVCL